MKKYFLMGLFFFSLVSCQREIDKYYEIPDWLKGNAYEVMEDRGNFSIFMKAVDRSSLCKPGKRERYCYRNGAYR